MPLSYYFYPLSLLVPLLFACVSWGQCSSEGPLSASDLKNNNAIGNVAWLNPNNAASSDNVRATAGALVLGQPSNYLFCTDFGFSIPTNANVCGVEVHVERSFSGVLGSAVDQSVGLVVADTIAGTDHAFPLEWSYNNDGIVSYGGEGDMWSTSLTPQMVNDTSFGVALSVNFFGLALSTARIDHVSMTVHYQNATLPIELVYFRVDREGDGALVKWATLSESNNDYFTLERSSDNVFWEEVAHIQGMGTSSVRQEYHYMDAARLNEQTYYRLRQTDFNGDHEYFEPVVVTPKTKHQEFSVFPNPTSDFIQIKLPEMKETARLQLVDVHGKAVLEQSISGNYQNVQLSLQELPAGLYTIQVYEEVGKHWSAKLSKTGPFE